VWYQHVAHQINDTERSERSENEATFAADLKNLAGFIDLLVEGGYDPPQLPRKWESRMRAEGWLKQQRGEDGQS
jgi:hypothetical protein